MPLEWSVCYAEEMYQGYLLKIYYAIDFPIVASYSLFNTFSSMQWWCTTDIYFGPLY